MVDMGITLNITKSPSPKCYMTFLDMAIYSDMFHRSDILLNRDLVTGFEFLLPTLTLLPNPMMFCNGCG